MEKLHLKKDGLFTSEKKKFFPIDKSFSYYLNHYPKIEKGFTVEDLMNFLKNHETEVDNLFLAYTEGFLLEPFSTEMNLPIFKESTSKIGTIEFSWRTDINNVKEFGKPKFSISEYVILSGFADNEEQSYSLSFVNLNEIKNAVFKINKNIKYSFTDFGERWDENRKVHTKTFFKGIKHFTLQDIIGGFLNEISFYGYPNQSDEIADKLELTVKNIDISKSSPLEVLQLKWAKKSFKEIQNKKESKKNFLRLEKLKKEIEYLENVIKKK